MNPTNFDLLSSIVSKAYIEQAQQARSQRENVIKALLAQRRIPHRGWDDQTIEFFLAEIALMDSNNFLENVGAGEREGRVYSSIVAKRHFRLAHGVGRSGDISEVQPKAAGSSLIYKLANKMALDIIKLSGIQRTQSALILPTATGMSITLCLLTLKQSKPQAHYIIWPRIDQKACFKGLTPVVVENKLIGDELRTDVEKIEEIIADKGVDNILCVLSTTSCFAPRGYDMVDSIAKVCKANNLYHLINNAYGLQDSKCTHLVNEAIRVGEVTFFVQSTDKNLLVPVGGAIVASPHKKMVQSLSQIYPGRASASPIIDVFITLLSMGEEGYLQLLAARKACRLLNTANNIQKLYAHCLEKAKQFAEKHGEKVLITPNNRISIAITLEQCIGSNPTFLGSMLFSRSCSGARVISNGQNKKISGYEFRNYGSHSDHFPYPYLTTAAAIGGTCEELDIFFQRLDKSFIEFKKKIKEEK